MPAPAPTPVAAPLDPAPPDDVEPARYAAVVGQKHGATESGTAATGPRCGTVAAQRSGDASDATDRTTAAAPESAGAAIRCADASAAASTEAARTGERPCGPCAAAAAAVRAVAREPRCGATAAGG